MRKIAIIPTLLTLANAVCGFGAIACASKVVLGDARTEHFFAWSGWLIIAAMVFDALDGYVARLAKSSSKFGAELDSLCDAISFGAAPAYLLLRLGPGWEMQFQHHALAGIATLFMVCALLRLARYNVESFADPASTKRFRGLPSPGAAGCVASLAVLRGPSELQPYLEAWAALGGLVVALLMVSRIPFPHITKQILSRKHHFSKVVQLIVAAFVIVMKPDWALACIFWVYALGVPLRYAVLRSLRPQALAASNPSGLDEFRPN